MAMVEGLAPPASSFWISPERAFEVAGADEGIVGFTVDVGSEENWLVAETGVAPLVGPAGDAPEDVTAAGAETPEAESSPECDWRVALAGRTIRAQTPTMIGSSQIAFRRIDDGDISSAEEWEGL
ncbi:MAG TPA: hypothetical protein VGG32_09660 [Thermoplasmata archaeon]